MAVSLAFSILKPLRKFEFIIVPSPIYASFLINIFCSSTFAGQTTGKTGRPYLLAKSKSLWSCAGQPNIAPVPYEDNTKLAM